MITTEQPCDICGKLYRRYRFAPGQPPNGFLLLHSFGKGNVGFGKEYYNCCSSCIAVLQTFVSQRQAEYKAERELYICDPVKNIVCTKESCGKECRLTASAEYAHTDADGKPLRYKRGQE